MRTLFFLLLTVVSRILCDNVIDKFFKKVGSFGYSDEQEILQRKTYYQTREVKMSWVNAFMFCRTFDMDLAELTTELEADQFLKLFGDNSQTFDTWYHIGGSYMGADKNDWYWMTSAQPVGYPLKFYPGQPDNYGGKEKCLSIVRHPESYKFNDVDCYETWIWKFVCQDIMIDDSRPESRNSNFIFVQDSGDIEKSN